MCDLKVTVTLVIVVPYSCHFVTAQVFDSVDKFECVDIQNIVY